MASLATTLSSSSSLHHQQRQQHHSGLSRPARRTTGGGIGTASTPNLNTLYSVHSRLAPPTGLLARKSSLAALTPVSLASIPDDSESYALDTVLNDPPSPRKMPPMSPLTPGKGLAPIDDLAVGEQVEVPGNMMGTVRFVGSVAGRRGVFVGVELHSEFALRGKNSGEVDGVSYFATSVPGSGIFVPINKLLKGDSPASAFPRSPSGMSLGGLRTASQNVTNFTPPTPSLPKFSQSVGPGRAVSPQGKRPRTSLPRPDSPVRKLQLTPAPRPTIATPAKPPSRYGSPTVPKFASSVRGTIGDPNKSMRLDRKPSIAPRSVSALGQIRPSFDDEEPMPPLASVHAKANGSLGSITSSMGFKRPASRANQANEEELERLKSQLEDRDRQLREQASALAEMESSLSELTVLIDQSDNARMRSSSLDGKDTSQLRAVLREKNEKIAMLTAEFDTHRADFRSTIDTLEMASTETQRVYDAKIQELEQELQEIQERHDDVEGVARQLKQLEELVQELEEGLEDARRGEAEARGEVEFLRGEVERTRSELRREREKASAAMNGGVDTEDRSSMSKDLEQKEDEIRGLKAIIHSLSRDSIPGSESPEKGGTQPQRTNSLAKSRQDSMDHRMSKDKLERELIDLRGIVDKKSAREEELEREIEMLRRKSVSNNRGSSMTVGSADRSSYRDSKGTVILARDLRSPEETHKRSQTLDPMPESDALSSVTETSTLWCEICETSGHDILTCTNMFGGQNEQGKGGAGDQTSGQTGKDTAAHEGLQNLAVPVDAEALPRPLSPLRSKASTTPAPASIQTLPNPQESGPLAGKESGIVDPSKWCAMCERDGHDSIDCPLEDAF
ncbi:putative CAP-Gly domain-containing protein [Rosellinia necatrix]|uniref:Putative CAP-Gly domain-containing protein n=1 Tax=Rosellinia necatrix TaxID=77044 RepID=A0A1W2TDY7_ROSNE|nr:putative CAP-Gly domain-containing protein [Rosellinia necatrix]